MLQPKNLQPIKVLPMDGLLLAHKQNIDNYEEGNSHDGDGELMNDADVANVITSVSNRDPRNHKVVIDLDMDAKLLPSSTPGHHHLLIDHEMDWDKYKKLLRALEDVGLIEEGYLKASLSRGFTAVRLPWIKKPHAGRPKPSVDEDLSPW